MHWSAPHIEFLRSTVPEIADVPLYLLTASESATDWQSHWMAVFSQLADLQAQQVIENLGLWAGRGCCILVRDDFESWSTRPQMGTLLHEAAHAIEHLIQPDALATELSPICREWIETGESKMLADAGIDRNDLIREQHGPEFIRLAMHLLWRARTEIPLSAADVQFLHSTYSLPESKFEAVESSLAAELAMSRNLNLTRLREAPEAFTELFT